jgi:type IV pilus assembly protein PilP
MSPAAGLRDPFRPFNLALRPKPVETPRTPLEQYDVGALKLVAVIYDTQNPKAMVEDDTGLGFTVGVGTRIGNQGGVVKQIDPERLVVEEEFVDFYGEKKKSEIVLRLKPEGEKRP